MSGFTLPGGPPPASPWHSIIPPRPGPANGGYNGAPALPTGWGDFTGAQVARPTPDQLGAGGHTAMSMPNPATQTGYGAPTAPAPPPAPGTPGSTAGGAPGFAGGAYYQSPEIWARGYLQSKGIDPNASNPFGDWFVKFLQQLAPAVFHTTLSGTGAPALDKLANPGAIFDKLLYGGSGTTYGNLQQYAADALAGQRANMTGTGTMDYQHQLDLLNSLDTLATAGMNPYEQNARQRAFNNAYQGYLQASQNAAATGQQTPPQLYDYLMQQNPNLFNYGR